MLVASTSQQNSLSVPVVILIFLVLIVYSVGYARAVMVRANKDYKTTKAAVPALRKAFWASAWKTVKVGFWVFVCVGLLTVWFGRRNHDRPADASVKASPSASLSRQHGRR